MKILVVSYYLPPYIYSQSIQVGRLLYYLADFKEFELYVVTAKEKSNVLKSNYYSDLYNKFRDILEVGFNYNRYIAKIKYVLLPIFYAVPDVYRIWNRKALKKIIEKWSSLNFDLIITFSYPQSSHLLGIKLKEYFHTKWLAFFSDPWVDNPYYNFKYLIKKINQNLEKKVISFADALIFVSQEMTQLYKNKYPLQSKKMHTLEHSFDPKLYPLSENIESRKNLLIFRYIGNFSAKRNPEFFLKALNFLFEENPSFKNLIKFEIIGGHRIIPSLIKRHNLTDTVIQKPFVDYLESHKLMVDAGVLVVIDANCKENIFLPAKLIEYLGAKRPILGITPKGASERVIKKTGGFVVYPDNIKAIKEILKEIIKIWRENKLILHIPSQEVLDEYDIKNKIKEFKKILDAIR